jgi:hypothetical protein
VRQLTREIEKFLQRLVEAAEFILAQLIARNVIGLSYQR